MRFKRAKDETVEWWNGRKVEKGKGGKAGGAAFQGGTLRHFWMIQNSGNDLKWLCLWNRYFLRMTVPGCCHSEYLPKKFWRRMHL